METAEQSIDIDALPSLLAIAARATCRDIDSKTVEEALQNLHKQLFCPDKVETMSSKELLEQVKSTLIRLDQTIGQKENQLKTEYLLLEAVAGIGHLLLEAVSGGKPHSKAVRRMSDVTLPILFLRTNVTPSQLRMHALGEPWSRFDRATKVDERVTERVRRMFASWHRRNGWEFMRSTIQPVTAAEATAVYRVRPVKAASLLEESKIDCRPGFAQPRVTLRDISLNAPPRKSATDGIPSYLLMKRRCVEHTDRFAHLTAASADVVSSAFCTTGISATAMQAISGNVDGQGDLSANVLNTPPKRRRCDIVVCVPPSPDRPQRS